MEMCVNSSMSVSEKQRKGNVCQMSIEPYVGIACVMAYKGMSFPLHEEK